MKNLKKVLAMVLAFACTFTMFAGAKVFEDVPAGSDYSEAITMLSDLGIIQGKDDGKYHPEDTITRAEACAMIARMMTGDPNVSQYVGAQNFTDVAKGSWKDSAIGYCYINNIVIGVGNNKFEPDRAITDAEFITMVVRAMGYETPDMAQGYPYTYMSNAQAIGLMDGVDMVANTDALRGEDAQVIYNALFADYARGAKLVNTTHGTSVETYPTLAESVWGLTRAAVGTWDKKDDEDATLQYCDAHTWVVIGANPADEGHILAYAIDDDDNDIYDDNKDRLLYSFKYDGDVSAVAGYQVELWGEGSHGEPEWKKNENKDGTYVYSDNWTIKAIKTVKGQTSYDYNASLKDSKPENGTIELGETSLDLDAVAANAEKISSVYAVDQYVSDEYNTVTIKDPENVEEALNIRDGAQYKLVDWDSDGDVDWVVVNTANYYKVESVSSKRLTVSYMDTKGNDEEDNTTSKTLTWKLDDTNDEDGYKLDIKGAEDLAEGDIIEVTYTVASDDGDQLVTGTISKVEADTLSLDKVSTKNNMVLTFDGETMELAQNKEIGDTVVPANPSKYAGFDEEELGTEFNIWTDRNGFIVYSDYATDSTSYMMVLDTADGSDKVGNRDLAKIDFVDADNKLHKDVEVTSSARVLQANGSDEVKGAYEDRVFDEELVVGKVYKYWTYEAGPITKMQAVIDGETTSTEYEYVSKNDRLYLNDSKQSYALEDADVIFAVKSDYIKVDDDADTNDKGGLKVNDADVMAVQQSDIPDIGGTGDDTTDEVLDKKIDSQGNSWIGNETDKVTLNADKNKDVSAAVLGVNNFNKFNAADTKVGLVTNVSYDSKDVVSIDVAYNGKVETLSSAEKVDFDDIVSVFDNGTDYSVGSRTEDIKNGIMTGSNLKDYLNKSAAYAEITTDADGKLTGVLFMDKKDSDDNTVVGKYYQVSRKVIADVKDGDWISTVNSDVYYGGSDSTLTSIDTKNAQVEAADFADEVFYYTIDGAATRADDTYTKDKALAILGEADKYGTQKTNFDGNPDIAVAEASDLVASDIFNESDSANDTYYVADIASKIDKDGKGDVTAVYMFEDELDEADGASANVGDIQINKDGTDATATADIKGNVVVESAAVVDKNGNPVAGVTANVDIDKQEVTIKVAANVPADTYTLQLKDRKGIVVGESTITVTPAPADTLADYTISTEVGTAEVDAVAAKTVYAISNNNQGEVKIAVNGKYDSAHVFDVTLASAPAQEIADAIGTKVAGYTVSKSGNGEVTIAAGNAKQGEVVSLEVIDGEENLTLTEKEKPTTGVAAVAPVAGKVTLTLKGAATAAEADNYTLTVGAKTFTVAVAEGDTAAEIAEKVAKAVAVDGTYDVSYKDGVVTITEKTGVEGTLISKNATWTK